MIRRKISSVSCLTISMSVSAWTVHLNRSSQSTGLPRWVLSLDMANLQRFQNTNHHLQAAEALNHNNYLRVNFFHKCLNPVQHFLKCLNNATSWVNISFRPLTWKSCTYLQCWVEDGMFSSFISAKQENQIDTIALIDPHRVFSWG